MDESRGKRIEDKLDRVQDDVTHIRITQGSQHAVQTGQAKDIAEHIKRTNLLEQQIKPIETKVAMVEGAVKLIGVIAVVAGIIQGIIALLEFLKNHA